MSSSGAREYVIHDRPLRSANWSGTTEQPLLAAQRFMKDSKAL